MALPKIEAPRYELTLPSKDKKIEYRPFLVKEEKVLLLALEDGGQQALIRAVKDIVKSCTFNTIDVENSPLFDLEYVFLQIRAKSVGEISKLKVLCPDDNETYADVDIDLTKIEVQVDEEHSNEIVIDKDKKIGIFLRYPSIDDVEEIKDLTAADTADLFNIMARGIDTIYYGDKTYTGSDYTKEEMNEFLENLDAQILNKIKRFYDTAPKLTKEVEVVNPKTNVKSKVTLEGLYDFFG